MILDINVTNTTNGTERFKALSVLIRTVSNVLVDHVFVLIVTKLHHPVFGVKQIG